MKHHRTSEIPASAAESTGEDTTTAEDVTLGQRMDRISKAAKSTWVSGLDTVAECRAAIDIHRRVRRNPYACVAVALGSGYVLGGGTFSPFTTRLVGLGLRLGLRLAAIPFLERELFACSESSVGGDRCSD